jgi:flavin reductase (DIM6/NTAB) family NADH-FMN oxidoreductase RutF
MDYERISPLLGRLWSPLAAVTSQWEGQVNAQICMAISNASIVPQRPRVLVQIYKGNYSHHLIHGSGAFALNFLGKNQVELLRDFGFYSGRNKDKLAGIAYDTGVTGSPVLKNCWGYLDCRVVNAMDGGDLTCLLADVEEGDVLMDGDPLGAREARRLIPPDWNEQWDSRLKENVEISQKIMDSIDYTPWKP